DHRRDHPHPAGSSAAAAVPARDPAPHRSRAAKGRARGGAAEEEVRQGLAEAQRRDDEALPGARRQPARRPGGLPSADRPDPSADGALLGVPERARRVAALRGRVGKPAAEERRLTATDNSAEGSGSAQERRRPRQREAAAEARSGWSHQGEGREETRVLAGEGVRTNRDEVNKTMRSAEGRGRTLDEAVDSALIELGETRRNVDVRVVRESPDETVVEVTVMEAPDAAGESPVNGKAETVRTLLEGLLKHMGVRASVQVRVGSDPITLDVTGRDLGALIGWRGETLRALQSVTNVMVGKH